MFHILIPQGLCEQIFVLYPCPSLFYPSGVTKSVQPRNIYSALQSVTETKCLHTSSRRCLLLRYRSNAIALITPIFIHRSYRILLWCHSNHDTRPSVFTKTKNFVSIGKMPLSKDQRIVLVPIDYIGSFFQSSVIMHIPRSYKFLIMQSLRVLYHISFTHPC